MCAGMLPPKCGFALREQAIVREFTVLLRELQPNEPAWQEPETIWFKRETAEQTSFQETFRILTKGTTPRLIQEDPIPQARRIAADTENCRDQSPYGR